MNLTKVDWTKRDYQEFISYLKSLQDKKYQEFHKNLISDKNINIIGIRIPILKSIAKQISKGNYQDFLKLAGTHYYEEKLIYGLIITNLKNNTEVSNYLELFIPKIDNWATCDTVAAALKIVKKHKSYYYDYIKNQISSNNPWLKRFCFVLLLDYYIEEPYLTEIFNLCEKYNDDNYYVNMAIAWLISICYIKYPNTTITFLKNNQLNKFTHNKAIQKIIESTRINNKNEIKELKRL